MLAFANIFMKGKDQLDSRESLDLLHLNIGKINTISGIHICNIYLFPHYIESRKMSNNH